eukprot:gene11586-24248_t
MNNKRLLRDWCCDLATSIYCTRFFDITITKTQIMFLVEPLSIGMMIFIFMFLLQSAIGFRTMTVDSKSRTYRTIMQMQKVAVIGVSGGVAEVISLKLKERGIETTTILDSRPCSPILSQSISKNEIKFYYGDIDKGLSSLTSQSTSQIKDILNEKLVIIVGDEGDEALRVTLPLSEDERRQARQMFGKVIKSLPPTVKGVISALSTLSEDMGGLAKLMGDKGSTDLQQWCEQNNKPFSNLKFGKLIGGVPGREPLPFFGLPLLEPELHPSYILRSAVLSVAFNKYAQNEICTRETLGEVLSRLVDKDLNIQAQVISIAGKPPLDKEWDQIFARVVSKSDVELLRIDFGAMLKMGPFTNWIVDSWFPQALIDADAATVLTGARPVRVVKTAKEGVIRVMWEDVQPDLTIKPAGEHEIRLIGGDSPALSVVRMTKGALPGEIQLMERLVEAVNKNAYKKQFCTPQE